MRVELCSCERSVTEELLDSSQIRPTFQDMCRCGVSQAMWSDLGNPADPLCCKVYGISSRSLIKASTTNSKK